MNKDIQKVSANSLAAAKVGAIGVLGQLAPYAGLVEDIQTLKHQSDDEKFKLTANKVLLEQWSNMLNYELKTPEKDDQDETLSSDEIMERINLLQSA